MIFSSKKKLLFLFCLTGTSFNFSPLFSQINYVKNPGFEDITDCMLDYGQADKAKGWIIIEKEVATPDLFNACSTNDFFLTPHIFNCNILNPHSGDGMVGLVNLGYADERIYSWFSENLPVGVDIYVAYHLAPRAKCDPSNEGLCYANSQALAFADASFKRTNILELDGILDIFNEWTKKETCYQATGEEVIVMLGNYKPASQIKANCNLMEPDKYAYYYIDDVIVSPFDVVPDTLIICGDSGIEIDAGFYNVDIEWSDGISGGKRTLLDEGKYTVMGILEDCVMADEVHVIKLLKDMDEKSVTLCSGKTTTLSSPLPAKWNNGFLSYSIEVSRPGKYTAELFSECGTTSVIYNIYEEDCKPVYYVANIFTPNNDGINDEIEFIFEKENLVSGELFIYDRWGNLVLCVKDPNPFIWDGIYEGKVLTAGVYVWVFNYIVNNSNGPDRIYGEITLIHNYLYSLDSPNFLIPYLPYTRSKIR